MPHSATDTCESRLKNIFATAGARQRRTAGWGIKEWKMEEREGGRTKRRRTEKGELPFQI